MDSGPLNVPVPSWAKEALEAVHLHVREALPETLQSAWNTTGFGLTGFDRQPLRPYLALLVARHYGHTGRRPLRLASSIHMIHLASLLHDRLGTARKVRDAGQDADAELHQREALDILLGDFFFSQASRVIVEDGETRIIEEHIRTSLRSAETQASIVNLEERPDEVEPGQCFDLVADKVSLLLALSTRVGALLGKARREEEEALAAYGHLLGRVVRILEDLTFWESPPRGSSPVASETKFSHPLILLWEREGRGAWKEAVRQLDVPDPRNREALGVRLGDQGYTGASREVALDFAKQALRRLDGLAETEEARRLKGIAHFHVFPGEPPGQEVTR